MGVTCAHYSPKSILQEYMFAFQNLPNLSYFHLFCSDESTLTHYKLYRYLFEFQVIGFQTMRNAFWVPCPRLMQTHTYLIKCRLPSNKYHT